MDLKAPSAKHDALMAAIARDGVDIAECTHPRYPSPDTIVGPLDGHPNAKVHKFWAKCLARHLNAAAPDRPTDHLPTSSGSRLVTVARWARRMSTQPERVGSRSIRGSGPADRREVARPVHRRGGSPRLGVWQSVALPRSRAAI